jgi:hypothetical protein
MTVDRTKISPLFLSQFEVDDRLPFQRHLNRLEVEVGREDYRHLKRVELLDEEPTDTEFAAMVEITDRLLKTTQNNYNRDLLTRLQARIYLDQRHYTVYYRLPDRCLRFEPTWRKKVLQRFFRQPPTEDTGWRTCGTALPDFAHRYLPDQAGGVLLLRHLHPEMRQVQPLITASHGPYDPHTLEVALYFLRSGKGASAAINLGFSGREPLTDECLVHLAAWGVPLNPSNIDVIYPYVDEVGHPYCYKLEEGLPRYITALELDRPELVIDVHGCVGTYPEDNRVLVGLGGLPPYHDPTEFGGFREQSGVLHLFPSQRMRQGLSLLRELSSEIYVQLCAGPHRCYNFALLGGMQLLGAMVDPQQDVASLIEGEERTYLPHENLRWLPGAGANALQRLAMRKLNAQACCLHVEIPTAIRRKIVLKLHTLEIEASLDASSL